MADFACPQCAADVPRDHQFCGSCGFSLRGPTSVVGAGAETQFFSLLQTPGRAKLTVIKGEGGDGISYALNAAEHTAGRESGVILFPDDAFLSPEHASFHYRDQRLYLTDQSSTNGTFVRVREPHHLSDGDLFMCGQQLLRLDLCQDETDYPDEEGTLMYVSPNRHCRLQVVQVVEGGLLGAVASAASGELTIGREGCELSVEDDIHLSRRHARVSLERDGRVLLTDLGSRNGTFVRVKGEVRLAHGDYVFMGSELLRVEIVE